MAGRHDLHDLLSLVADPPDGPLHVDANTAVSRWKHRQRHRALLAVVTGVVALGIAIPIGLVHDGRQPAVNNLTSTTAPPSTIGANLASLLAGRWAEVPPAPIVPRSDASVVWTGQELVVWGGQSGPQGGVLHADGAAFDPSTNQWRSLPASPLSARTGQSAVWTGTEVIIWGGYDFVASNDFHVTSDGAAYNPHNQQWRKLPATALSARTNAIAVWTGTRVILLGGQPAVTTNTLRGYGDGASYDPSSNRWQHIDPPTPPNGHSLTWTTAVQAGQNLLAWSEWTADQVAGPPASAPAAGVDIFTYDEHVNRWQPVPAADDALPDVRQVLWTGQSAIVRGSPYNCRPCAGPFVPEVTDQYDPTANTWTRLPADPLAANYLLSTWTGQALFSFNPIGSSGTAQPGNASGYDPASNQWIRLPAAPYGCDTPDLPIWTGRQILMYCPVPATGSGSGGLGSGHDGLSFTPSQ